jgi:hypothetical protein
MGASKKRRYSKYYSTYQVIGAILPDLTIKERTSKLKPIINSKGDVLFSDYFINPNYALEK